MIDSPPIPTLSTYPTHPNHPIYLLGSPTLLSQEGHYMAQLTATTKAAASQ